MKSILLFASVLFLSACGGGDSSSGGAVDPTAPGSMIPANFVGTYTGTVTGVITASAAGISIEESDTFPITFTVAADGNVTISSPEIDETVVVGVTNDGSFVGVISRTEDPCEATINVVGTIDGTTASGTVNGTGTCTEGLITVDATLTGEFTATK